MSSTVWLLDRSRVVDGRGFCQRSRALNYHLGPSGYGMQRKATKLPLMTGIAGHLGLAPILEWCRDHDDEIQQALQLPLADGEIGLLVPTGVVRTAIQQAQADYWEVVKVRGFAYLQENEEVQFVTREQQYLIEGLIWAWCLDVLPEVLRRGRVLEVEHDDTYVFDCSCGLGDGVLSLQDHEARDCEGKGLMCRPDFLLDTRATHELEYHEFKTTSMDSPSFRDKWEVSMQMFAAVLDAERRHQRTVQSIYVHGLVKGKRGGEYNQETGKYDGEIRQQSLFCYGYRKPAMPPMEREEWAAQYNYFDPFENRNRRLTKAFQKAGVWDLPDNLTNGMSKAEYWAKWIPQDARRKQLVLLGPFSRQGLMVEHFLAECSGEEDRWQAGLWQLYELALSIQSDWQTDDFTVYWQDARYQALLDRVFPRSYECRRYGSRMKCQFEEICFAREGWADPIGSGLYIDRRPHHADELQQAISRGLLLPEAGAGEDQEQELP